MTASFKGSLAAVASMATVGSLVAAADLVAAYPAAAGQAIRYALGAAILVAIARGRLPRLRPGEVLGLFALAASGLALFNVLVIAAVREGDPATIGLVLGCVPIVLALAGPLLERRRIERRVVAAAVLVAAATGVLQLTGGGLTAAGALLALGALACEAAFSLLAVRHLERLGALGVSAYACIFAAPLLAVWSLLTTGLTLPAPTVEQAAVLAYMALFVTAGAFGLWYSAIDLLGIDRAGLFSGVLPISALLCSAATGATELTPARLGAVAVVAAGMTLGIGRGAQPAGARAAG